MRAGARCPTPSAPRCRCSRAVRRPASCSPDWSTGSTCRKARWSSRRTRSNITASCASIRRSEACATMGSIERERVAEGRVTIHTDGACSGNPGPGGYGAILQWGEHTREIKGGEPHTTNNRMELMAAIVALETLKRPCTVDIHTDSQYLRNGIMSWINGWKRNGWKTADKKPVKNVDLWQRLDAALAHHTV